jgi:hypothetical protein
MPSTPAAAVAAYMPNLRVSRFAFVIRHVQPRRVLLCVRARALAQHPSVEIRYSQDGLESALRACTRATSPLPVNPCRRGTPSNLLHTHARLNRRLWCAARTPNDQAIKDKPISCPSPPVKGRASMWPRGLPEAPQTRASVNASERIQRTAANGSAALTMLVTSTPPRQKAVYEYQKSGPILGPNVAAAPHKTFSIPTTTRAK